MPAPDRNLELRIQYLEEVNRWINQALEVGASLNDSFIRVGVVNVERSIFKEVMHELKKLFDFEAMAFMLVDEMSNEFVIRECDPYSKNELLQQEIDYHIDQGSFSWALHQSRACIARRSSGQGSTLLHVLSTRSRIRGMFIALQACDSNDVQDHSMNYLSMLLLSVSNSLSSHELYRYVNEHNRNLEQVVAKRTSELEDARMQAEAANKAKSSFLANMSHEIRTPLTSVIGYAEWLKDDSTSADERHEAVDAIVRTGKHVQSVINDILDLSKIESNMLTVELIMVSLGSMITELVRLMTMHATDKGLLFNLAYEFPLPRMMKTDPTRLKQILINLCSNAIKFTERGSVCLRISCRPGDGMIDFSVEDSGIGIEAAKIDKLFDSFTQADVSTTRRFGGTGLGLNISRHLAQMLGGDIKVTSNPGEGSHFVASVATDSSVFQDMIYEVGDIQAPGSQIVEDVFIQEYGLHGRVLLAEDNVDNQRLVGHYLKRLGLDICVVDNGQLAVERALEEEFDLVLMDMQMPKMDGPEAAMILRQTGRSVPIVALTANMGQEDRDRCISAGCNDFLCKPIDKQHFFTVVSRYLKKADDIEEPLSIDSEFDELKEKYIELISGRQHEVSKALAENDRAFIKSSMHQFKGSAGGYGFPELGWMAARIEAMLKADINADVAADVDRFIQECQRITG